MKTPRRSLLLPLFILSLAATGVTASAQVLYSQNFVNNTGNNIGVGSVGWNSYVGPTAVVRTNSTIFDTGSDTIGISFLPGNPSTSNGYFFTGNGLTPNQIFAATGTFSALTPSSITWKQGNSSTSIEVHLMVQSEGNWYATSEVFANTSTYNAASFSSGTAADLTKTFTFTTDASAWMSLTLAPGSTLALGPVFGSDLPSSSITGIGFYVDMPSTGTGFIARMDTLSVVPEAGTSAMAGLGLASLLFFRKRSARI